MFEFCKKEIIIILSFYFEFAWGLSSMDLFCVVDEYLIALILMVYKMGYEVSSVAAWLCEFHSILLSMEPDSKFVFSVVRWRSLEELSLY